jgi:hypothetical protein
MSLSGRDAAALGDGHQQGQQMPPTLSENASARSAHQEDAAINGEGDTIELLDFSPTGILRLSRQEFYSPNLPPHLVVLASNSAEETGFNKNNMISQNFMGICFDEISNCIRYFLGHDFISHLGAG